jgi:hypothetical protein
MSRLPGAGAHPPTFDDRTRKSAAEPKSPSGEAEGRTEVSLEAVIRRVTEEVVRELARQGVKTGADGSCGRTRTERGGVSPLSPGHTAPNNAAGASSEAEGRTERIDMTGYKTPVLLERHVNRLHALTRVVAVPKGTVVSLKAREELKDRNIILHMEE